MIHPSKLNRSNLDLMSVTERLDSNFKTVAHLIL